MSLFFTRRKTDRPQSPERHSSRAGVSVTVTRREADIERGLEFERDPQLAARIRNNLPGRPLSSELRACRVAAVLDKQAAFLADRSGTIEPPERFEVVEACQFAAEFIRDRIVVGVGR